MKITENLKKFRDMKIADLESELKNKRKEFTLLSLKIKAGKEDNISLAQKQKKEIARLNTIIVEKKLEK